MGYTPFLANSTPMGYRVRLVKAEFVSRYTNEVNKSTMVDTRRAVSTRGLGYSTSVANSLLLVSISHVASVHVLGFMAGMASRSVMG